MDVLFLVRNLVSVEGVALNIKVEKKFINSGQIFHPALPSQSFTSSGMCAIINYCQWDGPMYTQ